MRKAFCGVILEPPFLEEELADGAVPVADGEPFGTVCPVVWASGDPVALDPPPVLVAAAEGAIETVTP